MIVVISLDGLSCGDLEPFWKLLPQSRKFFDSFKTCYSEGLFAAAAPIWAEFLTAAPWFKNGCAGYSRPKDSLNNLAVFSETDLLEPLRLLSSKGGAPEVLVNVPLTRPKSSSGRVWLSDGSLPTNKVVSPNTLRQEDVFSSYLPRPFPTMALAEGSENEQIQKCLEAESKRLDCALALFHKQNWSKFIYRLSIFDQLSHSLGLNFLSATDLCTFSGIREFLNQLDNAFQDFFANPAIHICLVSAYSHQACHAAININSLLYQGGFFELEENSSTAAEREATDRVKVSTALFQARPLTNQLASMQGRIRTASSSAASPVSGCVFVNSKRAFSDGSVSDEDYQEVRRNVGSYLRSVLTRKFGNAFSLEDNPESLPMTNVAVPEFIVKIEGVDFHDLEEASCIGIPRTTHSSSGFALFPKGCSSEEKIKPIQLASLLENLE